MDTRDRRPRPPASRDVLRENQRDGGLIPVFFPLFLFLCLSLSLSLPPSPSFLFIFCVQRKIYLILVTISFKPNNEFVKSQRPGWSTSGPKFVQ